MAVTKLLADLHNNINSDIKRLEEQRNKGEITTEEWRKQINRLQYYLDKLRQVINEYDHCLNELHGEVNITDVDIMRTALNRIEEKRKRRKERKEQSGRRDTENTPNKAK